MSQATDPHPHFADRLRAAWRAFRDPNGVYLAAYTDGIRDYPRIRAGVAAR